MARALTEDEATRIREKAAQVLESLQKETAQTTTSCNDAGEDLSATNTTQSWLTQEPLDPSNTSDSCRFLHQHGFLVVKDFVDSTEIDNLKQQMIELAQDWNPQEQTISFRTDEESNKQQGSNDYFLESASRVHFFAEPSALDKDGALLPQYQDDKLQALNKAGHGMHMIPGAFQTYASSEKLANLVHELGWKDPVIPQSMYIFKHPIIGEAVNSHQDSTFLYTSPKQSCLGLWLALDDATLHNGCLWVRPKSHHEPIRRQFVRNVDYFGKEAIETGTIIATGDLTQPKMSMTALVASTTAPPVLWEGLLPNGSDPPCNGLLEAGFVPVECKAGDLVCFVGSLDHLSLPNYSKNERHTFQLHLVEGPNAGIEWARTNWLQYPKGTPFLSIKKKN